MNLRNSRPRVALLAVCLAASGCATSGERHGAADGGVKRTPAPIAKRDSGVTGGVNAPALTHLAPDARRKAPVAKRLDAAGGRPAPAARGARPAPPTAAGVETGIASYYADKYHGRRTASGEVFDQRRMTAAHRTLPFGTRVRVTPLVDRRRSVVVRVNDRGPFVAGRVIDLSRAAADKLGMVRAGLMDVRVEVLDGPETVARGG